MVTRGIVLRALDLGYWLRNLVDACVLECNGTPDTDLTIRTLATEFSKLRLDTESYYTTGERIAGFVPEISKRIIAGIKKPGVIKCLSDKLENYVELWKPDIGVWMGIYPYKYCYDNGKVYRRICQNSDEAVFNCNSNVVLEKINEIHARLGTANKSSPEYEKLEFELKNLEYNYDWLTFMESYYRELEMKYEPEMPDYEKLDMELQETPVDAWQEYMEAKQDAEIKIQEVIKKEYFLKDAKELSKQLDLFINNIKDLFIGLCNHDPDAEAVFCSKMFVFGCLNNNYLNDGIKALLIRKQHRSNIAKKPYEMKQVKNWGFVPSPDANMGAVTDQ